MAVNAIEKPATERQRRILQAIAEFKAERGYPPSVREIGERVGLSSSSTILPTQALPTPKNSEEDTHLVHLSMRWRTNWKSGSSACGPGSSCFPVTSTITNGMNTGALAILF